MHRQHKRSGLGGWLFLAIVLFGYGLSFLLSPESTIAAYTFFLHALSQVLPVLGLVFLLLFIINFLLTQAKIEHYLGKEAGLKGWMVSVVAGIFSMGPVYAWYAVMAELHENGMRKAFVAAFLYSRAVKLSLLPLMIHYFGAAYTAVLCLYLVVFSVINGIVVERLMLQKS
jgi:uncharacterized membrane protein YraQ (UPF0718 family)